MFQRPFPFPLLRDMPAPSRTQTSHRLAIFSLPFPTIVVLLPLGTGSPHVSHRLPLPPHMPPGAPAVTTAHGERGLTTFERGRINFFEIRDPPPDKGPVQVSQEIKLSGGGPAPMPGILPALWTQVGMVATSSSSRGIGELGPERSVWCCFYRRRRSALHA